MSFSVHIRTNSKLTSDSSEIESDLETELISNPNTSPNYNEETLFIEDYLLPCTPNEKVRHYLIEGSLHLYKNISENSYSHDNLGLILNIPDYMGVSEIVEFLSLFKSNIRYFRCIKQERTDSDYLRSQMMVLLRVDCDIDALISEYHGEAFSKIDNQICNILKLTHVYIHPKSPINDQMIEFPNCPVCLERIDTGTSGIMTILCNHSFHCDCLLKWGNSCPVCRNIEMNTPCSECLKTNYDTAFKDVWICLICGNVGCGRYAQGHAYNHFQESDHCFALEIKTQRVWDYINDEFVHRLIQGDGKIVQTDPHVKYHTEQEKPKNDVALLLTTQLDSQRHYFEQLLKNKDMEVGNYIKKLSELEIENQNNQTTIQGLQSTIVENKLSIEHLQKILKVDALVKNKLQQEHDQLQAQHKKLKQSYLDEVSLNKVLRDNQNVHQKQKVEDIVTKDKEIEDLKEQLRDLMFYVETREKVDNLNDIEKEEIQQGTIHNADSGKKKKKKKKK